MTPDQDNKRPQYFTPEQIRRILLDPKTRAGDNPTLYRIGCRLIRNPDDSELQDLFGYLLNKQNERFVISGDVFWPNYPIAGTIVLGRGMTQFAYMPTGDPVAFTDDRIFCGIGVFGRTGGSKSSLIRIPVIEWAKRGYLVIVFQSKDEYADLATMPELKGKVLPLRANETMISIFQEHKGTKKGDHTNAMLDNTGRSYERLYAPRLSHDILEQLYRRLQPGYNPPLAELIDAHEKFRPGRGSVEAQYRESMLYTWREIHNSFGGIFDYYKSDFFERLAQWRGLVTVQIDAPVAAFTFYAMLFVYYFYLTRKSPGIKLDLLPPVVIVLEDATLLTSGNELHGESPLTSIAFMARQYKMGFVYANHTLSASARLLANLESIFVLGMSDQDPHRIQQLLTCTPEQAARVSTLQPGEAIARIPSMWPQPVYCRFPYIYPPRKLTEEERLNIVRPFLNSITAVKYVEHGLPVIILSKQTSTPQPSVPATNYEEIQMLTLAAMDKSLQLCKLYDLMGVNRRDGRKIMDRLELKGLLRPHTFATGKVGGQVSYLEITDAGWQILIAKGFVQPLPLTGGGFLHDLCAKLITSVEKTHGRLVRYEVDIYGKRLDVESRDSKTGERTFFNIGVSSPDREADSIDAIVKLPALTGNKFVFVGIDNAFVKQVKEILKAKGWKKDATNRLDMRIIGDFITD
jgi:hypothetical protein